MANENKVSAEVNGSEPFAEARRVRALPEMVPWCDDIDVDDYVPYPRAAKRLNAKYAKLRTKK